MIAMGVAEDQAINARGVDVEQVSVAQYNFRRVAEVQHVLRLRARSVGFKMQRKTPFACKRGHLTAWHLADVLDHRERMRALRQEALVARIDDDADSELVNHGRREWF